MSWEVGFDFTWNRDIGYGVPAICDHPDCQQEIDRGLAYVCEGEHPYGGERGCGLYFCDEHADYRHRCERCQKRRKPFKPKPDTTAWVRHKLRHRSWKRWRDENPEAVEALRQELKRRALAFAQGEVPHA